MGQAMSSTSLAMGLWPGGIYASSLAVAVAGLCRHRVRR
jgi:hypothetical protein